MKSFGLCFLIVVLVLGLFIPNNLWGDERSGTLVFEAMKRIQETYRNFLQEVKEMKQNRKAATGRLEEVKKQYLKAPIESLDRRQFHAQLSYNLASVYTLMGQEAALTKATAKKQFEILSGLAKSLKDGETSLSSKQAEIVVNSAKPIIENSRSLFQSLTQFKDQLKDPEIPIQAQRGCLGGAHAG